MISSREWSPPHILSSNRLHEIKMEFKFQKKFPLYLSVCVWGLYYQKEKKWPIEMHMLKQICITFPSFTLVFFFSKLFIFFIGCLCSFLVSQNLLWHTVQKIKKIFFACLVRSGDLSITSHVLKNSFLLSLKVLARNSWSSLDTEDCKAEGKQGSKFRGIDYPT